jgi:hypothetical protein
MPEDLAELTITISFEEFLTRFDLDEIISSIDAMVEQWVLFPASEIPAEPWERVKPDISYVGIKSVEPGSIVLLTVIGTAIATYVAGRFAKGVNKSIFGKELARSGRIFGDAIGPLLRGINDWAEKYVPQQREAGGHVTGISAQAEQGLRAGV